MAIDLERRGPVALVTVNRPEARNALSSAALEELRACLRGLADDAEIRVVVLTGAGDRAFIAGADIAEMARLTPLEARAFAALGQEVAELLETMPRPTIAAVNGYALGGGCELALACDLRFCAEGAVFAQPEIDLGIMPGWGGSQRLARTTSLGFAKELILTGRRVAAPEALARGLVQAVHPAAELLERTLEVAAAIAAKSPVAAALAKEACNGALHGDLATALRREADLFALAFSSDDAREGLRAFTEKRDPRFVGR